MKLLLLLATLALAIVALARVLGPFARLLSFNLLRMKHLRNLEEGGGAPVTGAPGEEEGPWEAAGGPLREDFVLTGAVLAVLGLCAVFIGQSLAYGVLAVTAYFAGLVCIVLGVAVALVGAVVRVLARPIAQDSPRE